MDATVRLFDADGLRLSLPPDVASAPTWEINERGGMAEVRLSLSGALSYAMGIMDGARAEVLIDGGLVCRGYLTDRSPAKGSPDEAGLVFFGLVNRVRGIYAQKLYLFPSGRDAYEVFALVAADLQTLLPDIEIEAPSGLSGFLCYRLDGRQRSFGDLLDMLCDLCEGRALWGFGVASGGADQLYFRLRGTSASAVIPVPAPFVSVASASKRVSDVVNRLRITGGVQQYPNLVPNASFENLVEPDENAGNLLANPSFEEGPPTQNAWDVPSWSYASGTSAKQKGGPTGEPDPYDQDWHIETSAFGEAFWQDVSGIKPGHRYGVICYARPDPSDGYSSAGGSLILYWKNGGSLGGPANPEGYGFAWLPIDCDIAAYKRFSGQWIAPSSGVDGCRIRAELNLSGGSILWDKFTLIDLDEPAQEGWSAYKNGTGAVTTSWAWGVSAHGAYSVKLVATSSNNDTNDVILEPLTHPSVTTGATYWFLASYQTSAAATIIFAAQFYKSDGSTTGSEQRLTASHGSALTAWTRNGFRITAPSDAASVRIRIRIRSSGTFLFDAFTLQDTRAYDGVPGVTAGTVPGVDAPYLPDGEPTLTIRAEDVISSGEDGEANASAALYGERWGQETASDLTTLTQLTALATSYLRVHAKAQRSATIEAKEDRGLTLSDMVSLEGADGPALCGEALLRVSRIGGSVDQVSGVTLAYDLGIPEPSTEALVSRVARRESRYVKAQG